MCKYINCDKEPEPGKNKVRRYCNGTDCYSKQNALDAKIKREANKVIKMSICLNDECKKPYPAHPMKKYCCPECRVYVTSKNMAIKHKLGVKEYNKTKEVAKMEHGNSKMIDIPSNLLVRGNKHYNGLGSLF